MTEKRFKYHTDGLLMEWITDSKDDDEPISPQCAVEWLNYLYEENNRLKQFVLFPIILDNRIQQLEESLKILREMKDDDLNPQAVEDVATVIAMSLNALMEFRKELKGDVE